MNTRIILTVLGSDRPGLTQSLADAVMTAGGNWLESQLARLGGQYVGAVLVELDAARVPVLEAEARRIASTGLQLAIVEAGEASGIAGTGLGIELVGQDRPGIVREVTSALAGLGVNIEEFTSSTDNTAWSGEMLFRARAWLILPSGVTMDAVRGALEGISGEIMVDLMTRKDG